MQQAAITFSDDVLLSFNMSVHEIVSSMRKEYAAKMYQEGRLTLGQAAEFCGVCLYDFTALLAVQDIPVINYDPEDLDRELLSIGVELLQQSTIRIAPELYQKALERAEETGAP